MKADGRVCCYCGGCVGVCPFDAIRLIEKTIEFNEKCTECGICEKFCPVGAINRGAAE